MFTNFIKIPGYVWNSVGNTNGVFNSVIDLYPISEKVEFFKK